MNLQRKLIVVALASAMPWISAQAQTTSDLQREIELLKAQLKSLQERIDSVAKQPAAKPGKGRQGNACNGDGLELEVQSLLCPFNAA